MEKLSKWNAEMGSNPAISTFVHWDIRQGCYQGTGQLTGDLYQVCAEPIGWKKKRPFFHLYVRESGELVELDASVDSEELMNKADEREALLGTPASNPTVLRADRFATWLGNEYGHGSWVYTWSDVPVTMDIIQLAHQRGYAAGYHKRIGENPADYQLDHSSPDLRLVTLWYRGFKQGERDGRLARGRPTLRRQNPWTGSAGWPVYEYKIVSRGPYDHRVVEYVRRSSPSDPLWLNGPAVGGGPADYTRVLGGFDSIHEAQHYAVDHMKFVAKRQVNNPNPVRLLDKAGKCIYAVRNTWASVARVDPKRVVPWWREVSC